MEAQEKELAAEEVARLPELEKPTGMEELYKGLQHSVTKALNDQNEVNKWFYNLQLCFCENYIALANVVPVAMVTLSNYRPGDRNCTN